MRVLSFLRFAACTSLSVPLWDNAYMLRIAGIIAGAAGIVIFFFPVLAGIFNFGVLAGTLLSACLVAGCLLEPRLQAMAHTNTAVRIILRSVQAGYVLFLVIAAFACLQMYRETRNLPSEDTDQTMIVLGCGLEGDRPSQMLWRRLTAAETYLRQHPDIPVIVSGGQGSDEIMPEALCMKNWLLDHGIPEERIFMEDRSSTTYENLKFSKAVIEENDLPEQIIIVTNNFHSCRAAMIARKQGYSCTSVPAKTTWWLFPVSVLREVFGIVKEWVF